jgi:hypothetical protein
MRVNMTIVVATAILFGTTAFAAAQNDASQKSKTRHLQNAAPERTYRPYAGNYNAAPYGRIAPGAGLYNYAPGQGNYYNNYYNRDYWMGVWNVAPVFRPGSDQYIGTPFDDVAPY